MEEEGIAKDSKWKDKAKRYKESINQTNECKMNSLPFFNVLLTIFKPGPPERSQDLLLNEVVISSKKEYSGERNIDDLELPLFDFDTMALATENFSDENKLGQGGFGCVYKVISLLIHATL